MEPKQNFDQIPEGVTPQELDTLFADLEQYDKDHNSGTWLGRGLAALLTIQIPAEDEHQDNQEHENIPTNPIVEAAQSNLKLPDIIERHNGALHKLGLGLESPNKEGDFDGKETFAVGEVTINVIDKNKFISFLQGISENPEGSQKKLLEMVIKKLTTQIAHEYDIASGDERFLEIVSGIPTVIEQYQRLGIGAQQTGVLADYLVYIKRRLLKEYIFANNRQIFQPIGRGFNLSTYQRDSGKEHYIKSWDNNFFDILDSLKDDPKKQEFYQEVLKYGRDSFVYAEKDIESLQKPGSYSDGYMQNIREGMKQVKEKLATYQ